MTEVSNRVTPITTTKTTATRNSRRGENEQLSRISYRCWKIGRFRLDRYASYRKFYVSRFPRLGILLAKLLQIFDICKYFGVFLLNKFVLQQDLPIMLFNRSRKGVKSQLDAILFLHIPHCPEK